LFFRNKSADYLSMEASMYQPLKQDIERLQVSDASQQAFLAQEIAAQLIQQMTSPYRKAPGKEIAVAALEPLTDPDAINALIDALAAFLQTRRGQPYVWPEEDPYEEGPPEPDNEGEAAVEVLRALGTPRVLPLLVDAQAQQHYNVAEAAREALRALGG
jgi:hypothetical protein